MYPNRHHRQCGILQSERRHPTLRAGADHRANLFLGKASQLPAVDQRRAAVGALGFFAVAACAQRHELVRHLLKDRVNRWRTKWMMFFGGTGVTSQSSFGTIRDLLVLLGFRSKYFAHQLSLSIGTRQFGYDRTAIPPLL